VLVAEDDEADAYLICGALARLSRVDKVVRVSDGFEALRMVEQAEVAPDLALIDLQMPRKGGLSLLLALAERPGPGFPLVVLTSSKAPVDAMRSRLRGAVRVISKPDTTEALQAELAAAIEAVCSARARGQPHLTTYKSTFQGVPSTAYLIAIEEDAGDSGAR
jgi:CheY-like chemotaxis protein